MRQKVTKINLRIISQPIAYLQTMTKTHEKFQNEQTKTVGGVAITRSLSIHFDSIRAFLLRSKCEKSDKNISQPIAYLQTMYIQT